MENVDFEVFINFVLCTVSDRLCILSLVWKFDTRFSGVSARVGDSLSFYGQTGHKTLQTKIALSRINIYIVECLVRRDFVHHPYP